MDTISKDRYLKEGILLEKNNWLLLFLLNKNSGWYGFWALLAQVHAILSKSKESWHFD